MGTATEKNLFLRSTSYTNQGDSPKRTPDADLIDRQICVEEGSYQKPVLGPFKEKGWVKIFKIYKSVLDMKFYFKILKYWTTPGIVMLDCTGKPLKSTNTSRASSKKKRV